MRLFTAIGASGVSFDKEIAFKKVKTNLLKKEIDHRWVPVNNYHCTLNFLGEVREEKLPLIQELLTTVAQSHSPFELKLQGMDAFPEIERGRVLYLGVQNSKLLRALQEDLKRGLEARNLPFEDRPYVPHLTVARLRNPRNLRDILSPAKNQSFGTLSVVNVSLFESKTAGGSFPVYQELFSAALKPLSTHE